jgi:predicted NBD/HSP70 family sugar kinase
MPSRLLIGVDIGGTKTAVLASLNPPSVLERIEFPTRPARGPGPAIGLIKRGIRELLSKQLAGSAELAAIGVSCGSPLDPIRGADDMAGEIGHVRLTRSGPVGYDKAGSAEGWVSGGGMAQVAQRVVAAARRRREHTLLAHRSKAGVITARDVGLAAQRGDALAQRIVRSTGRRLGEALAILVDLLNPERIVIGGLAMRLGDMLLEPARRVVRREALAVSGETCQIVPAALDERIGDVAALCIAMGL